MLASTGLSEQWGEREGNPTHPERWMNELNSVHDETEAQTEALTVFSFVGPNILLYEHLLFIGIADWFWNNQSLLKEE